MPMQIIVDAWEALDVLSAYNDVLSSEDIGDAAGDFASGRIYDRTLDGRDVNDALFVPYAKGSRKRGTPNLYDTGAMLGSLSYTSNGATGATIECASDIAKYHQEGTDKMPKREFMGLTPDDEFDLVDEVIRDPLKRAL